MSWPGDPQRGLEHDEELGGAGLPPERRAVWGLETQVILK